MINSINKKLQFKAENDKIEEVQHSISTSIVKELDKKIDKQELRKAQNLLRKKVE